MTASDPALREAGLASKAWPFEEARKLAARAERLGREEVVFETGYGPSGLPHIGTFGEVARTTMVRRAFEEISDLPTRLICFSDDLDGMRKVPDNVPNPEMMAEHMQRPLTAVPDPFGTHESFGAHNNAMLRRFLDTFGFDYEFVSAARVLPRPARSTRCCAGPAERYDDVMAVMLPTPARGAAGDLFDRSCRSSPSTGRVLYVPMLHVDAERGDRDVRRRGRARDDAAGHGREREAAVEAGFRRPLGGARRGLRDVRQGARHQHGRSTTASARSWGARRRSISVYELFLDEAGRRSPSRRATA